MKRSLIQIFAGAALIMLISASEQSPDKRITMAVAPPRVISMDKDDSSLGPVLASFLIDEMNKSTTFKVIDLEMSDQVEKLLAFANSDKCDQTQCHIAVGNLIPASKLLAGTLARLGDKYTLSIRLIDIEKGVVEFSAKEQMSGKKDDLDQLTQLVALDLREHFGERVERPVLQSQPQMTPAPQPALPQPAIAHCEAGPITQKDLGKEYQLPGTKGGAMLLVAAGDFCMGCNEQMDQQCKPAEKPYHKVYLDSYYIDKFDITTRDYNECVSVGGCKGKKNGNDRLPVTNVSWEDANTYCQWAGKRLPTEAEWEKAARGTEGRIYPWGNEIDASKANYGKGGGFGGFTAKTTPVGNYPSGASPYGALDMAGNVWNWVADWYGKDYYQSSPDRNPKGPVSGQYRVLRGGSWYDSADLLRAAYRGYNAPSNRDLSDVYGFRCARTP